MDGVQESAMSTGSIEDLHGITSCNFNEMIMGGILSRMDASGSPPASGSDMSSLTSLSNESPRPGSPTPQNHESSNAVHVVTTSTTTTGNGPPPAKKRKVTLEESCRLIREKHEKKKEKEKEQAAKAEKKARLDEERRVREMEQAQKRQAKELLKQVKEEERQRKEVERKKKEDEKEKKNRSQLRLQDFFTKPASAVAHGVNQTEAGDQQQSHDPTSNVVHEELSDYRDIFRPYHVYDRVQVAPLHMFVKDSESLRLVREQIDKEIQASQTTGQGGFQSHNKLDIVALCHIPSQRRGKRGRPHITTKEVIARMVRSDHDVTDLTGSLEVSSSQQAAELIARLRMKHLKFDRDVRPPYAGTFTKAPHDEAAIKLCRNPFERSLPQVNYDYDSEAEWEAPDPEDGEDLSSEDEEVGSEGDADEMDGFLDDEETAVHSAATHKRRLAVGNLEPVCIGPSWESSGNDSEAALVNAELSEYKLDILKDAVNTPIDPYSESYWTSLPRLKGLPAAQAADAITPKCESSLMNPPRLPLLAINRTNAGMNASVNVTKSSLSSDAKYPESDDATSKSSKGAKALQRSFPLEHLAEFQKAIQGSDLTKTGLVEVLKKKFPKISKDMIKDTLSAVAQRVGARESEKVWTLVGNHCEKG